MTDICIEKIRFSLISEDFNPNKYDILAIEVVNDSDLKKVLPRNRSIAKLYEHFLKNNKLIILLPVGKCPNTTNCKNCLILESRIERRLRKYIQMRFKEPKISVLFVYGLPQIHNNEK